MNISVAEQLVAGDIRIHPRCETSSRFSLITAVFLALIGVNVTSVIIFIILLAICCRVILFRSASVEWADGDVHPASEMTE